MTHYLYLLSSDMYFMHAHYSITNYQIKRGQLVRVRLVCSSYYKIKLQIKRHVLLWYYLRIYIYIERVQKYMHHALSKIVNILHKFCTQLRKKIYQSMDMSCAYYFGTCFYKLYMHLKIKIIHSSSQPMFSKL